MGKVITGEVVAFNASTGLTVSGNVKIGTGTPSDAIYPNKEYAEDYDLNNSLHHESIPLQCQEGANYHEQAYEFIKLNKTYLFDSEEMIMI